MEKIRIQMKKNTAERSVLNFLPILSYIIKKKQKPMTDENGEYYVLSFKCRGQGIGRGGRSLLNSSVIPLRRKFLCALKFVPQLSSTYDIRVIDQNKKARLIYIKKDLVDEIYDRIFSRSHR